MDDDNEPAPENVPEVSVADNIFGEWGHNGVCERKKTSPINQNARLKKFSGDILPTIEQVFLTLFPMTWVQEVIIPETNKCIKGKVLTVGKFLRWLGLWFIMATFTVQER